jgi:enoyl-CoA hydratase
MSARRVVEFVFDDGGMNLLSSAALQRIDAALPDDADVFVFRSGRPRLFAAGADMAEMQQFSAADAEAFSRLGQDLFARIERLPFATLAFIDGDCFGGALDLALAFDVRIATPRSRFAHPGARLGIVTGFGGTTRWRGVIDRRAANQLFLANRVFSAEEALAMHLVDAVSDSPEGWIERLVGLTVDR